MNLQSQTRGRADSQDISGGSSWNVSLADILSSPAPDFSSSNLTLDDGGMKALLELENDACEKVALDLCMPSYVHGSKNFSKPGGGHVLCYWSAFDRRLNQGTRKLRKVGGEVRNASIALHSPRWAGIITALENLDHII